MYILKIALGTFTYLLNAFQMYKPRTNKIQRSCYTTRLAGDGMTYFVVILLYAVVTMLVSEGKLSLNGWQCILVAPLQLVAPFTLVPRFILSLRELYARDLRGRLENGDIGTAFGLGSMFGSGAVVSAIVFADGKQNEGNARGDEEIQMEERAQDNRRASSSA